MSNIDLKAMSRTELVELIGDAGDELKRFRPYRIKERMTTCGNEECWCWEGEFLHGPYLYASYRDGGKTKQVSLGPKLEVWEMIEGTPTYPDVADYLFLPNHKYEELPVVEARGWVCFTLSVAEFEERHGVTPAEDNFDRARKFWGKQSDYDQYRIDVGLHNEYKQVPYNPWSGWGVGNLAAIATLTSIEARGYYQK